MIKKAYEGIFKYLQVIFGGSLLHATSASASHISESYKFEHTIFLNNTIS